MSSNVNSGRWVNAATEWAAYDSLPPEMRRLVRNQAHDYNYIPIASDMKKARRKGLPLSYVLAEYCRFFARDRAAACLKDYGPRHPEAQA